MVSFLVVNRMAVYEREQLFSLKTALNLSSRSKRKYGSAHLGHKACVHYILESSIPVQACVVAPLLLRQWQEMTYQEHGQGPFEGMASFPVPK